MIPYVSRLPKDAHPNYIFSLLGDDFAQSSAYYLDLWPMFGPVLMVTSPSVAIQACQQHDLEKPDRIIRFFQVSLSSKLKQAGIRILMRRVWHKDEME